MLNWSTFACFIAPAPPGGGGGFDEEDVAITSAAFGRGSVLSRFAMAIARLLPYGVIEASATSCSARCTVNGRRSPLRGERSLGLVGSASAIWRIVSLYTSSPERAGPGAGGAMATPPAATGAAGATV